MDPITLTAAVTTTLLPVLPYLLKAGEKAAEEADISPAFSTLKRAQKERNDGFGSS